MPGNFKKEDLRIVKTKKALLESMFKLLENRSFNQITVNDLCLEAQISRATFYAHFVDKYDLLRYWLAHIKSILFSANATYEDIAKGVNNFAEKNIRLIRNLLENTNEETFELLCQFMFSLLDIDANEEDPKGLVFARFCSGGMLNYLLWQARNRRPLELQMINRHVYDMIMLLHQWYTDQ